MARRLEAVLIVERLGSGRARLAICGEDHQRLRADDVELNVRAARNFEFDVRAARDSHRLDGASFARSFVIQSRADREKRTAARERRTGQTQQAVGVARKKPRGFPTPHVSPGMNLLFPYRIGSKRQ